MFCSGFTRSTCSTKRSIDASCIVYSSIVTSSIVASRIATVAVAVIVQIQLPKMPYPLLLQQLLLPPVLLLMQLLLNAPFYLRFSINRGIQAWQIINSQITSRNCRTKKPLQTF